MKVQALSNGYYCEQRIRRGDIFELKERTGFTKDEKTGKKEPFHFSVEQQFSERWMRKVVPGQAALEAEEENIDLPGVKIRKPSKKRTLSDGDSVI